MAEIHRTTLVPSKLELLTGWLPTRPWYAGHDGPPLLERAGGFRLDDPAGEVGIELMLVRDRADGAVYLVPMTYRGAPGPVAGSALVGTMEHGVLGPRWAYDGPHDPVFVAELVRLLQGRAVAQHQSVSGTTDPSVHVEGEPLGALDVTRVETRVEVADTATTTDLTVHAEGGVAAVLRLHRVPARSREDGRGRLVLPLQGEPQQEVVVLTW